MPRTRKDPTPTNDKGKRGRPKKAPLGQATIYDHRIEDHDLAQALQDAFESADEYKRHRQARAQIKELLQTRHGHLVLGLLSDEYEEPEPGELIKGPYAICGEWRFLASAPVKPAVAAGTKDVKAKPATHGWKFDAEKLLNGGNVPTPDPDPPEIDETKMIVDGADALVRRESRRQGGDTDPPPAA